jgi:hypothetical protein
MLTSMPISHSSLWRYQTKVGESTESDWGQSVTIVAKFSFFGFLRMARITNPNNQITRITEVGYLVMNNWIFGYE